VQEAATAAASDSIELRLRDIFQLFNTLDPFPFRVRDLAPEAVEYIVEWAQDLPKDKPIEIVVHLQSGGREHAGADDDITRAIAACFAAKANAETKAMRQLFRDCRRAFLIAIPLLALCLVLAWKLSSNVEGPLVRLLPESLVIVGWVVLWRPVEMCLYDWLPFVRRRKLYRRLAASQVTVQYEPSASLG
jgi:hypothetical protein